MVLVVAEVLSRPLFDAPVPRGTGISMRGDRQAFQIRVDHDKRSDVESCSCLFGNLADVRGWMQEVGEWLRFT
jgi:hypothetical protein